MICIPQCENLNIDWN